MTFLNPAVLFVLIAAVIPLLLHLLNLRKLKTIEFSTLAFLKELQKNKIRRIILKQWLLLALRILIILLLVTAFARPALKGLSIGGTTSAAKTTAVFIIDDTFSMSVIDEKGSHFNQAKRLIRSVLNELQEGDQMALIRVSDAGSQPPALTTSLASFRKSLDDLTISYSSGTLHNAMAKAASILSSSQNFNKEIFLFSDLQKSRINNPGESFSDFGSIFNDRVKLYTFNLSKQDVFNIGIDSLTLNSRILEAGKPVSFTCSIKNYSSRQVNNYVVSLFLNGSRSAQSSVSLKPNESRQVILETTLKAAGLVEAFAETEDDEVLQDNRKYLSFEIPEKTSAAVFASNPGDTRFVEAALMAGGEGFTVTNRTVSQISSVDLGAYDVILVSGGADVASQAGKIRTYLQNGGGMFLMPSGNTTTGDFSSALQGLSLPAATGSSGVLNSAANRAVFNTVDFGHPIFEGLFASGNRRQIESPDIYYYFRIPASGRGKTIITLTDNSPFLSEFSSGTGRIFVMASAPLPEWSSLPVKAFFAPLIYRSSAYLAFRAGTVSSFIAGEPATINLKNNAFPQVRIVKPDNSSEMMSINGTSRAFALFSNTELSGNYRVYSGDNLLDNFSVNASPLESDMRSYSADEFVSYLKSINFKGNDFTVDTAGDYVSMIRQARFGSELWRIFLILALVLAVVEMTVARSSKKETE